MTKKLALTTGVIAALACTVPATPAMASPGGTPRLCSTYANFVYHMTTRLFGLPAYEVLFGDAG